MEGTGGGVDFVGEATRNDNVVILAGLVGREEDRVRLTHVNVQRRVAHLERVRSFHLNQLHLVVLDPEVQRVLQPHIRDSKPVSFTCNNTVTVDKESYSNQVITCLCLIICHTHTLFNGESVAIGSAAIDEDSIGGRQLLTAI